MLKYRENLKLTKDHNYWIVQATCTKFRSDIELVAINKKIGQKFENNGIQDGGAAIMKFTKTWITSEPLDWFSPNLVRSFALMSYRQWRAQNGYFSKSKMAADEKLKFTENWITSKRFIVYAPNLAYIIHFAPGTRLWSEHRKIRNPRWPPAAITKFTKTWITPEPLVRFSPNLAQSFVLAPPRHRECKTAIFQNPRWPPTKNWNLKFTKTWITS